MTRIEMRELISYWADDVRQTYFTPAQVNVFLNNAYKTVFKQLVMAAEDHFLRSAYTLLVVGQQDYLLPSDFYNIRSADIYTTVPTVTGDRYRIEPVTLNNRDCYLKSGQPQGYYLKGNKIILRPVPDSAKYLGIEYIYTPTWFLSDGQTPEIPEVYHELIAINAAIDCFIKDGRDTQLLFDKRARYEKDFKSEADERIKQGPRMIRQTGF